MADFSHDSNFNANRNFSEVIFGAGAKLLEVELKEAQEIQNYRRNLAVGILMANGFINRPTMTLADGNLTLPADTVVCNGEVFEITENMYLGVTGGETVYLACNIVTVATGATLYKDGNLSGGSTITNNLIDPRIGTETTRRVQRQVQLVTSNADSSKTYLTIATIGAGGTTFTDTRVASNININSLDRMQSLYDVFKKIGFGPITTPTVTPVEGSPLNITTSSLGEVYFANGVKKTFGVITKTLLHPTTVSHSNENHTTTGANVTTTYAPITDSTGVITISGVTVTKVSDGSSVTVVSGNATTGALVLDLTVNTEVNINYYSGQKRYDTLYVSPDGTNNVISGTPTYTTPVKPTVPDGSLEVASMLLRPKETAIGISAADITVKDYSVQSGGSGGGKVTCTWTNTTTTTAGQTNVSINNTYYSPTNDTLFVLYNNFFLVESSDYTKNADGVSIDLVQGIPTGEVVYFLTLKNVTEEPAGEFDGSLITDGTITAPKLSTALNTELAGFDTRITSLEEDSGGQNNLTLIHSNGVISTTSTTYLSLADAVIFADLNRHKAKIKIALVTKGYGDVKVTISDGTTTKQVEIAVDLAAYGKKFAEIDCSATTALTDINSGTPWTITVYGKADSGQEIFINRLNIQAGPTDQLAEPTLVLVTSNDTFNAANWELLDTKYFPMNYAIDYACITKCLAQISFGTGVTGVSLKFKLTTNNGIESTSTEGTIDYTSAGIKEVDVNFPTTVAAVVKVEIYGKITGGSGIATLNHYEAWLGV